MKHGHFIPQKTDKQIILELISHLSEYVKGSSDFIHIKIGDIELKITNK